VSEPADNDNLAAALADWKGRRIDRRDTVTPRMVEHFTATLSPHLGAGASVPPGLFWCLAPDALPAGELGRDGHPRTGIYLPPVPYPRRMWAGGDLHFHGDFQPGDEVAKSSVVEDITFKTGASGPLCFVTVRHRYEVGDREVLDERQDIVYRQPPDGRQPSASPAPAPPRPPAHSQWVVDAGPTMLFRYSAITLNGHRIHYDHPYATEVEGYEGLVVHGPLQATLMLNLAVDVLGRLPSRFSYRGLAPLTCGAPFLVEADAPAGEAFGTRVVSDAGTVTMVGKAHP
jgi:3-methylfumaryl-CoA hydratase